MQLILARLGLGQRPTSAELRELWEWVPEGYNLVPIFSKGAIPLQKKMSNGHFKLKAEMDV